MMKPAFLVLVTAFFATGCPNGNSSKNHPLPVEAEHQVCTTNLECVLVQRDCSDCDCGVPVNKEFLLDYVAEKGNRCSGYRGPVCDVWCPSTVSVCLNNKCTEQ